MTRAFVAVQAAWAVALVATVGSLNFSGVPAVGWRGMGLFPCELCWYQRALMYPLVLVLGVGLLRRDPAIAPVGLALSVPGVLLATYHSLIQYLPSLEVGRCMVGTCTAVQYRLLGLTIPNLSLVAFALVTGLLGFAWLETSRRPTVEP